MPEFCLCNGCRLKALKKDAMREILQNEISRIFAILELNYNNNLFRKIAIVFVRNNYRNTLSFQNIYVGN